MQASVSFKYGSADVIQIKEVEKPVPQDNQVLIKTCATSVTAADGMIRKGSPYFGRLFLGLFKPKHSISGTGFSGIVEAVGPGVTQFEIGDQVYGETGTAFGAHAEFVCVPEDGVMIKKPENISHEEAAPLCDGALTSMNFLKNLGQIKPGQEVLINGASGGLGTSAIQLAKYFGAKVTAVCSGPNQKLVSSLGADYVIDYTQEDFTKTGKTYDIIYETVGKRSFSDCKSALGPNGVYISPVLGLSLLFQMLWTSQVGAKKALFSATGLLPSAELNMLLKELNPIIEGGHLKTVIDRRYSLGDIADAHRYVDTGHKKGNLVVSL